MQIRMQNGKLIAWQINALRYAGKLFKGNDAVALLTYVRLFY